MKENVFLNAYHVKCKICVPVPVPDSMYREKISLIILKLYFSEKNVFWFSAQLCNNVHKK
jgi:hypothetical protein